MRDYWKRKLMALLHDPPCKVLHIPDHESIAEKFRIAAGIDKNEYQAFARECDHTASAADRFPFPGSRASGCSARFKGDKETPFLHPLGGGNLELTVPETVELAIGDFQDTSGSTDFSIEKRDTDTEWQIRHFLYWRRWPEESARHDRRLAYLPADTRMPDHTIWNHMSLTSAFQGCMDEQGCLNPAFFIFQLGPVQDFIAAARSTRDLWSGSYFLSWLTAHAIKAVTDKCGPDSVIFPSLRGLGIFDAVCREDFYDHVKFNKEPLWECMYGENDRGPAQLLTPSLPNRFLALVPAVNAKAIARAAEYAVQAELKNIYQVCRNELRKAVDEYRETPQGKREEEKTEDWFARWERQLELFPEISWQVLPWDNDLKKTMKAYRNLPINREMTDVPTPSQSLDTMIDLACSKIPPSHRDKRFYTDSSNLSELNNPGVFWSAFYGLSDFRLSARRNTRDFRQWYTDDNQHGAVKDSLTGKEECIGSEAFWDFLVTDSKWSNIFKPATHRLGGVNLIKRLWCRDETGYLPKRLGIAGEKFRDALGFDSVAEVADGGPAGKKKKLKNDEHGEPKPDYSYFAVIAMDGDEMGKWVSGSKTPEFGRQLAYSVREYFESKVQNSQQALKASRPLSPSFHLQFSEALANFANILVPRVLKKFNAQLIYSGGDDVLLMVRADRAIGCAYALRCLFRGEDTLDLMHQSTEICEAFARSRFNSSSIDLSEQPPGWVTLNSGDNRDPDRKNQVFMVPGPEADLSCGIAVAHYQHPLQHVVREAQSAEKRAKQRYESGGYDRAAFAVSLLKRGGEIIHWGAKWESEALPLYFRYRSYRAGDKPALSARFPYALAELLRPYNFSGMLGNLADTDDFDPRQVIRQELMHVLDRQIMNISGEEKKTMIGEFLCKSEKYISELEDQKVSDDKRRKHALDDFEKLFLTAAFIDLPKGE